MITWVRSPHGWEERDCNPSPVTNGWCTHGPVPSMLEVALTFLFVKSCNNSCLTLDFPHRWKVFGELYSFYSKVCIETCIILICALVPISCYPITCICVLLFLIFCHIYSLKATYERCWKSEVSPFHHLSFLACWHSLWTSLKSSKVACSFHTHTHTK